MKSMFVALVLGIASLSTPVTAQPSPSPDATSPVTIRLLPWRTRWVLEAEVAGTRRKYLLDTGAGITLFSLATAAAAKCEPWGRITGYNMMGNRGDGPHCDDITFEVGGLALTAPLVGLIDMAAHNPRDAELDGIVGLNLFEGRTITLDFAAGTLVVETDLSRAARVAAMRALPIRLKREVDGRALAVMAAVPSTKGTLWMELDSGNGGTVLVSKPVAALVGLDPARQDKQSADFPVSGDARATTPDAFAPDMIMDGNLGMPFLRNWVITLDLARGLAWIGKPAVAPGPATPLDQAAGH